VIVAFETLKQVRSKVNNQIVRVVEGNKMADQDTNNRLDLTAETFDAELALKATVIVLPVPNAPTFDNLAKYASRTMFSARNETGSVVTSEEQAAHDLHQRLKQVREGQRKTIESNVVKPIKEKPNVLNWMESAVGPCSLLVKLMQCKVKVMVRRRKHVPIVGEGQFALVRGILRLFDRHLNLVLDQASEHVSGQLNDRPVSRERSLGQVLLRGDQVVWVCCGEQSIEAARPIVSDELKVGLSDTFIG
jgi:small nuclear ribonucleoprotein (snRNP)-like protein